MSLENWNKLEPSAREAIIDALIGKCRTLLDDFLETPPVADDMIVTMDWEILQYSRRSMEFWNRVINVWRGLEHEPIEDGDDAFVLLQVTSERLLAWSLDTDRYIVGNIRYMETNIPFRHAAIVDFNFLPAKRLDVNRPRGSDASEGVVEF